MKQIVILACVTVLAGCTSTAFATGPIRTPVRADAAPSAGSEVILRYGYHPLPYDNTGQGPGETGMEGGGG
jgi:hypothetical protein